MNFKFLSFIFLALFAFSSCDSGDEDLIDCPDLGLNFGDECELTFPDRPDSYTGYVSDDCECLLEGDDGDRPDDGSEGDDDGDRPDDGSDVDCPDLGANIGEECRDSNGNIGVVDSDCECN